MRLGANDYVTKPINLPVLLARMEVHLRIGGLVIQLEAQARILAQLAAFDELTGLFNRRSLLGALEAQLSRVREQRHVLSLLMLDLDDLKKINDSYGHVAGDAVLREFARRLRGTARESDVAGRFGGDEFCLILADTDESSAGIVGERVRAAIQAAPVQIGSMCVPTSVSIGIATWRHEEDLTPEQLFEAADRALYEAKRAGRNRVMISIIPTGGAEPPPPVSDPSGLPVESMQNPVDNGENGVR
jgi:two-component system, cell cycle response regulator